MVRTPKREVTPAFDVREHRRLVVQHYGVLRRWARRLAANEHEAADILHDALIVILCHQSGPDDPSKYASWCCGVVKMVARRAWQNRQKRRALSLEDAAARRVPATQRDLETACEQRDLLRHTLRHIDARGAELLERRYCFGQSSEEIAEETEHSAAAVRMRLKRVLDACGKAREKSEKAATS